MESDKADAVVTASVKHNEIWGQNVQLSHNPWASSKSFTDKEENPNETSSRVICEFYHQDCFKMQLYFHSIQQTKG